MKFCPNCGTQSEDGAMFCGECGYSFANAPAAPEQQPVAAAPVQQAEAPVPQPYGFEQPQQNVNELPQQPVYNSGIPQPEMYSEKKKNNLPVFIAIGVAAVVLIGIVAVAVSKLAGGGGIAKSNDFFGSQQAFIEERTESLTEPFVKDSVSTDVTVSLDVDGNNELTGILDDILTDSAIVVKTDADSQKVVTNAALHLRGSNVLEAFASMTKDGIRFSVPNANDNLYFMDLESVMEKLGGTYDASMWDRDPKKMQADIKEIATRYVGVLSANLKKDNVVTENRDVKLSEVGKTVKCTIMTWTPDEEELTGMCEAVAQELENDDKLAELLNSFAAASGEYKDGYDILFEYADAVRDNAADFAKETVEASSSWTVALDGKGKVAWISVADDHAEFTVERAADADGGKEAYYATEDGRELFMLTNDYKSKGSQRTGTLAFDTDRGRVDVEYDFDLSKRSVYGVPYGTYTPNLISLMPGLHVKLEVTDGASGGTDHIFTVDGLGNLTGDMVSGVTLVVNTTDKSTAKEPAGKETDLSGYSDEELMELFDELSTDIARSMMQSPEIMELIQMLGGAF